MFPCDDVVGQQCIDRLLITHVACPQQLISTAIRVMGADITRSAAVSIASYDNATHRGDTDGNGGLYAWRKATLAVDRRGAGARMTLQDHA